MSVRGDTYILEVRLIVLADIVKLVDEDVVLRGNILHQPVFIQEIQRRYTFVFVCWTFLSLHRFSWLVFLYFGSYDYN